ncbi:MAG: hypothetical protein C5B49_06840 [Bdellovibrio sp.]|nr:MAG: hypothetical protein C5B49_06840 [Bdellovibrio sp.]
MASRPRLGATVLSLQKLAAAHSGKSDRGKNYQSFRGGNLKQYLRAHLRSAAPVENARKIDPRGGGRSCSRDYSADRQQSGSILQPFAGGAPLLRCALRALVPAWAIWLWSAQSAAQFSTSYLESRATFRKVCENLKLNSALLLECRQWTVPSPTDSDLQIDYAIIRPPDAKKMLILTAGLHGVESFAGSAMVNRFFSQWLEKFAEKRIAVALVHTMNPYGFKNSRRVTENNVDLNRNFPTRRGFLHVENPGYQKLQSVLEPAGPADTLVKGFLRLAFEMILRLVKMEFTLPDAHFAVAGGQSGSPRGLFYAGEKPEPQTAWLHSEIPVWWQGMSQVLLLDFHTGLGKKGVLHVMPADSITQSSVELRNKIFPGIHPSFTVTPSDADGYYRTRGALNESCEDLAAPAQAVAAATLEFGTLGDDIFNQLRTVNRMVLENQGSRFGFTSKDTEDEVKDHFKELFFPSDPVWRGQVESSTDAVFSLVLNKF